MGEGVECPFLLNEALVIFEQNWWAGQVVRGGGASQTRTCTHI